MLKYAAAMNLPHGKVPGYYAQVVKALAKQSLFDRDKELLIVSSFEEFHEIAAVLERYSITYDTLMLYHLPANTVQGPLFDTCGFQSRQEHHYVFQDASSLFTLSAGPDTGQALLQMEEHLVAAYTIEGRSHFVAETQSRTLIEGIAQAYRVTVQWQ
jgi:hypothetical protein